MNNGIQTFDFQHQPVRAIFLGGRPWLNAADAASVLGLWPWREKVQAVCRQLLVHRVPVTGGEREYTLLGEAELRALVASVHTGAAPLFLDWILAEVFPVVARAGQAKPAAPAANWALVTLAAGEPRTSTLVLAEGTANDHASVIKLVRTYLQDLQEFGHVDFKSEVVVRPQGGGTEREFALLNEEQATLLLTYMRNNEVVRAFKRDLVKAFWRMRRHLGGPVVPRTLSEALRLAADLAEERATLQTQVARQASAIAVLEPQAQALARISNAAGQDISVTLAAKTLKIGPQDLFSWLERHEWTYRRGRHLAAYQDKIHAGYLTHHAVEFKHTDGRPGTANQIMVTPKGLGRLGELLAKEAR